MRVIARWALAAAIVFPAAAFGETRAEINANVPHWWLTQAAGDIPKIKSAKAQFEAYRDLLYPAAECGAPDIVALATAELDKLMAADAALKLNVDVKTFATRAKVNELALAGKSEAALALAKTCNWPGMVEEMARTLAMAGQTEQLRALAADKTLTAGQASVCRDLLLDDAVARNDKKAAQELIGTWGDKKNLPSFLMGRIGGCLHMDGTFDGTRVLLYGELLPAISDSGDAYAMLTQMLARHGYTKEAVAVALRVPENGRRADAIREACRALAMDGKADEAATIVEKESKKEVVENGYFGLAVGLALHDEAAAALVVFKKSNFRENFPEFEAALAFGPVLKSAGKSGLEKFKGAGDQTQRILAVQDAVRCLITKNKMEEAIALTAAYPGTDLSALQSRGQLLYHIAKVYRDAKNEAGVKQVLAAMDELLALAPEKEKKAAIRYLAFGHAVMGDGNGTLALVAKLDDAIERDQSRASLATNLAMAGDFKGVAKAFDALEKKPLKDMEIYYRTAFAGISSGHLVELGAWIATWPDAGQRVRSYIRISQDVAPASYRRRLGFTHMF